MRFKLHQIVANGDGTIGKIVARNLVRRTVLVAWNDGVVNKWDDDDPSIECAHENTEFQGFLGAPGFGQSYKCVDCEEALWAPHGTAEKVPFKNLDNDDYIMSPSDCI